MPLAPRTTVAGQGANYLATRRAAYENIQITLDHLRPTLNGRAFFAQLKKLGSKAPQFFYPVPAPHPRYRIPFWNIAPGDRVRVREGAVSAPTTVHGRMGTVEHVDRLYNRVFLKERVFKRLEIRQIPEQSEHKDQIEEAELEIHRGILYGDLQLSIGKYELDVIEGRATIIGKTEKDKETDQTRELVATGMRTANRRWHPRQLRFLWDRVPKHVRALVKGGTSFEPWLVPVPAEKPTTSENGTMIRPRCAKRVPWTHEEGYAEGKPVEGTIANPGPPPYSPRFDTSPAAALKPTWQPADLETLFSSSLSSSTSPLPSSPNLAKYLPELALSYSEFGNKSSQARRKRLERVRIRYMARRQLRAKRHGRIREYAEMPKKGGYFGPNWTRSLRPPNKRRERMIAAGKNPDELYGRETGLKKYEGVGGRKWPS